MKTVRPLLLLPLVLLTACQSHQITTSVLTDAQPDWSYASTYFLGPYDENFESHPRFRTYAEYVERALEPHGMTRIHSPLDADLVIFVHWENFRAAREPVYVPSGSGSGGIASAGHSIGKALAIRKAKEQARTRSYLVVLRALDVATEVATGEPLIVWETVLLASDFDTDTHEMLPLMLAAGRDDIGIPTDGIQSREIPLDSAEAAYIRTGDRPD